MIFFLKKKYTDFLLNSRKYLKTDIHYLIKNGTLLSVGQGVTSATSLALAIGFAHFLDPEVYGTYKYVLSIVSLFLIFTLPGVGQAVSRAVAKGIGGTLVPTTWVRVRFSLFGVTAALLGAGYYCLQGNTTLSLALILVAVFLPVYDTFNSYLSYLAGKKDFYNQTKYQIIIRVVSAAVLLCAVYFSNNLVIILVAYFLPQALLHIFFSFIVSSQDGKKVDLGELRETIVYGKHLTAMNVLGVISANIDKILLWKFLGPVQLAVYSFAIALPVEVKGSLKNIGILAFPKFAEREIDELKLSLPRKMFFFLILLVVITLLYILAAPYIFTLLFSQYSDSVYYSQIYSLSILFVPAVLITNLFSAHKKIKELYFMKIANPIILISLYVVLIPWLGILGAILTVLITNVISLILWLILLYKKN